MLEGFGAFFQAVKERRKQDNVAPLLSQILNRRWQFEPRVSTDADDDDDELKTDLGGLNGAETFLFPLACGVLIRASKASVTSSRMPAVQSSPESQNPIPFSLVARR